MIRLSSKIFEHKCFRNIRLQKQYSQVLNKYQLKHATISYHTKIIENKSYCIDVYNRENNHTYSGNVSIFVLSIISILAFNLYTNKCSNDKINTIDSIVDDIGCYGIKYEDQQAITNWSATHTCHPKLIFYPQSAQEVCRVLESHHKNVIKVRPIGTGLSPNGIAMNNESNLISLSSLDYVEVDVNRQLVTVGAGIRVSEVLKELSKYNLTLENFSSIQEQQMGGWTQVAAHGTGCTLSTVDDMIVRMKLATPTEGLITLSNDSNPALFHMAKVGLGCLGVVTELTLRCIPKHCLHETTVVMSNEMIAKDHYERLKAYRHVRYMWLPYTSQVVSVMSNPISTERVENNNNNNNNDNNNNDNNSNTTTNSNNNKDTHQSLSTSLLSNPLLLSNSILYENDVDNISFSQIRDILIAVDPLDAKHIQQVNQIEVDYWKLVSEYDRIDDSINILGFDCGGEQWVYEICIPIGDINSESKKDLEFMNKLLELIEINNIAAPSPIEQRWTARSTSYMSPAYSNNKNDVFSWIGIIMYLPTSTIKDNEMKRNMITKQFNEYKRIIQPLIKEYNGKIHWAKLELPKHNNLESKEMYDLEEIDRIRMQLAQSYPITEFNTYRLALDPNHILTNEMIDLLL